jgi:tRNA (cytosine38-C5)-methyltransferase
MTIFILIMKILELFSGIGGMHFALDKAGVEAEVISAIDISDVPNRGNELGPLAERELDFVISVYRHNFPATRHLNKNICGLTAKFINDLGVDTILMSPPCQPFTRQGNQKDLDDPRTQPLVRITSILGEIHNLKYILLENVKGLELRIRLINRLYNTCFRI